MPLDTLPAQGIHSHPQFKKGLRPRPLNLSLPHYSSIAASNTAPTVKVPASVDNYATLTPDTGMLGNASWGDCADAMVYHVAEIWSRLSQGAEITPTEQLALQLYAEQAGFDPSKGPSGSNPTDVGTDLVSLIQFLIKTGAPMPDGSRMKLRGAFEIDPRNHDDVKLAIYTCGAVYIGIQCWDRFCDVKPGGFWVPPLFAKPEGGHAIAGGKFDPNAAWIESWGNPAEKPYGIRWSDWDRIVEECYAPVSDAWYAKTGRNPLGLTMDTVDAIMVATGLAPVPAADPTPLPAAA